MVKNDMISNSSIVSISHSLQLASWFNQLWNQYIEISPSAKKIFDLTTDHYGKPTIDHIAFRTINLPGTSIADFSKVLLTQGYTIGGNYRFEEKKLSAVHFEKPDLPLIFLSQLELELFEPNFKELVHHFWKFKDLDSTSLANFTKKINWELDWTIYQELSQISEYASWLYVHGLCANHFTISLNSIGQDIASFNQFVKSHNVTLNTAGGEIKGSAAILLEQASTISDQIAIQFKQGLHRVPSCYVEFAKRYPDQNKNLYQGFHENSADKIFESTYKKSKS